MKFAIYIAYFHNVFSILFFHDIINMLLPFEKSQLWNPITFAHDTNILFFLIMHTTSNHRFSSQSQKPAIYNLSNHFNFQFLRSLWFNLPSHFCDLFHLLTISKLHNLSTYNKKTTRILNQYQGHMIL